MVLMCVSQILEQGTHATRYFEVTLTSKPWHSVVIEEQQYMYGHSEYFL